MAFKARVGAQPVQRGLRWQIDDDNDGHYNFVDEGFGDGAATTSHKFGSVRQANRGRATAR